MCTDVASACPAVAQHFTAGVIDMAGSSQTVKFSPAGRSMPLCAGVAGGGTDDDFRHEDELLMPVPSVTLGEQEVGGGPAE